jgi:hypothetical protein
MPPHSHENSRSYGLRLAFAFLLACTLGNAAVCQEIRPRQFILNEDMIRGVLTPADPTACNPKDVLHDLFRQIGPVARIYPTENYYYFSFYRGGKLYSASLRLAADSRDRGIVQYNCVEALSTWIERGERMLISTELSQADGVDVRKIGEFEYSIGIDGAEVRFTLNEIDQRPDESKLARGEHFAGRIFDESGLVFELIYNRPEKAFYFLLDTQKRVPESFVKMKKNVFIGARTGFVLYQDIIMRRLLLVAVQAEEIRSNTPYDGPFDQLPENYYEQLDFWKYVYEVYPKLVGKLTAGGSFRDRKSIFAIAPYSSYSLKDDLRFIDTCTRMHQRAKMLVCLTKSR